MIVVVAVVALGVFGIRSMNATAPEDLGVTDGRLAPLPPSPNGVSSQAEREAQRLEPFPAKANVEETLDAIARACEDEGGQVVTREGNYLHVIFRTKIMRYTDDVEWLADGDVLHFRSKSRVGYWDLGVNRRRIARLRERYTQ